MISCALLSWCIPFNYDSLQRRLPDGAPTNTLALASTLPLLRQLSVRVPASTLDCIVEVHMRTTCVIGIISLSVLAFGKDKPTVTIQVVDTQASVREAVRTIPGTAAKSTTNCNTQGNTDGGYVNANTDCTTTTVPGRPAKTYTEHIPQEHVHAVMPNGDHVTLWCQEGLRRCESLQAGSYTAEIKGNTAWVYTHELSGKVRKVKYVAEGGW